MANPASSRGILVANDMKTAAGNSTARVHDPVDLPATFRGGSRAQAPFFVLIPNPYRV